MSITVDLGPELEGYVKQLINDVYPETHAALMAEVRELRNYAQRNWPVLKKPPASELVGLEIAATKGKLRGRLSFVSRDSKSKWSHGVRMTMDGLEAFVINRAPYSAFAQLPRKVTKGKKKYYHKELLFKRFGAKRQNALWAKVKKELG